MDPEIVGHYAEGVERDRLEGWSLERVRTEELLARSLPPLSARILDVGGGAGRYASLLGAQGYDVVLLDPVELHVQQAAGDVVPFGVERGDARSLPHPDACFDSVLMLGPLYHLTERESRRRALGEGIRVLRPGGVIAAAAISRAASLLDGFARGFLHDERFRAGVEQTLTTGQHRNPARMPGWFTTAFFHRPNDLQAELEQAGAIDVQVYGIEGPAVLFPDPGDQGHAIALWAARLAESDPDLAMFSPHLLAVGRKAA